MVLVLWRYFVEVFTILDADFFSLAQYHLTEYSIDHCWPDIVRLVIQDTIYKYDNINDAVSE